MKKSLLFLFMLTLFVGFNSCSKDGDEDGEENGTFKWEGDIENYNPLVGLWVYENAPTSGLKFSEDKILYSMKFTSSGDVVVASGPFEINYKAYKYGNTSIRRYKLEGDQLTIYPNQNNNNDPSVLIKIK
jgi:hypothetical protein